MKMSAAKVLMLCVVAACFVSTQQLLGGEQTADPKDAENLKLLTTVVNRKNSQSNGEDKKIVKVTSSKYQVVSGVKHTMEFTAEGVKSKKKFNCSTVFIYKAGQNPNPKIEKFNCKAA